MYLNQCSYSYPFVVFAASIMGLCPIKSPTKNNDIDWRVVSFCVLGISPLNKISFFKGIDINNPNNFENHKLASIDYSKRPLERLAKEQIDLVYKKYYDWIDSNLDKINKEYYGRYAKQFTNK